MAPQVHAVPTFIRRPKVEAKVGLSRSSIYEMVATGDFPAPIKLGERAVGWVESEVDAWIADRIAASRKAKQ